MNDNSLRRLERVCNVPIHCWAHDEVLAEMDCNIRCQRESRFICITNTESMYFARRIPQHGNYIENADFSLCDGIGMVLGARLQNKCITRFNGPVLMEKACEYGVAREWRHFFYGSQEGIAVEVSKTLTQRYPGLNTAGTYCPPFRELTQKEDEEIVRMINEAKPDILWVCLGLLKQEAWIAKHLDRIGVPWSVGVGAAFDIHAGNVRWAPKWVHRIGLEWLYRLCFEPRMAIRNIRSFVCLLEIVSEAIFGASRVTHKSQHTR